MSIAGKMRGTTWQIVMLLCVAGATAVGGAQPWQMAGGQMGGQTQSHQTGSMPAASNSGSSPLGPASGMDTPSPFADNSRQRRNDERQRRLVLDTERLLALTTLLKSEVATTGAEAMSPEMLKQMAEIEKLAKSVKEKMRD